MEHVLILKDLAVIFTISLVVILAFHRFKLPALPGFIVAGVLVGPNALGLISDVQRVEGLAEVGVILLLFTIGIESTRPLREMAAARWAGLQMVLTTPLPVRSRPHGGSAGRASPRLPHRASRPRGLKGPRPGRDRTPHGLLATGC